MTLLHKPISRETSELVRARGARPLIVTLYPGDQIGLRPKGTRREERTTLAAVYSLAIKQRITRERADKVAARKARRSK
jgi:hypothetical protein